MMVDVPQTNVDNERLLQFKFIRSCVMFTASTEMFLGALSIASNLGVFAYYVVEATKGSDINKPDFFFENVIDLDLKVSAKTLSKIAAFMLVYSVVHFLASIFLYQGAKSLSHEKCRWSFIMHVCLWTVGIIIIIAPLNDKVVLWLFIVVFSLKIAELALIRRFMDELHLQGYDR